MDQREEKKFTEKYSSFSNKKLSKYVVYHKSPFFFVKIII